MRIVIFLFCVIGQGLGSGVKEHVALYIDPNCEGFSDEEEFVARCSSVSCPGANGFFEFEASPTIFQTVPGCSPEHMRLLPYMWTGDGIEREYLHWTEDLAIISSILQHGPQNVQFLVSEIKRRIPDSEWTAERVAQKIRFIVNGMVVSTWLHDLIGRYFDQGIVSVRHRSFSQELEASAGRLAITEIAPNAVFEIAQDWLDYCFRYPAVTHLPCMEVIISKDGKQAKSWALTAPQIPLYLRMLEQRALSVAENHLGKRASSERTPKGAYKEPRKTFSVRYHILKRLIESPDLSDERNMDIVNVALPSTDSITLVQYQAIKGEILKPTKQSTAFHHSMLAREAESCMNLGKDEAVWYKYCIEPLRARAVKKGKPNPCFRDNSEYRLSRKALIRYLNDELQAEVSLV